MERIFYFYIKDGRIEVTNYPRSKPPDKVVKVSNANGYVSIVISVD